ncbi:MULTISPECIES: DUF305 domain-containing protein [Cellulomonas]|uniref:DUF305 domain-containing protein n=1 Tax=Cellulomonas denverensis TaxID=264297 RepID=A0A7X6R0Q4_9CELL|nr:MULTISPECIES: DUF305 domain-containing protein [Cellulomonas]NKY24382.1 DUF305 domain-containing protein [Cellulomonas denverensis]QZN87757.1 DUF305 domain-containing protein [Cellulomonas sp. C5510]GIG26467.1 DUF305 domain-containing protein [Cellulomonas denverensis]
MSPKIPRAVAAVAATLTLGLLLSACSTGEQTSTDQQSPSGATSTAATSVEHNDADVEFAQMMILHHQGALDMAVLAEGRAQSEPVQELAARIQFAQQPEIDLMTSWLQTWGEQPAEADDSMGGMDHSGEHTGMADDGQMQQLQDAGADFDRMFLEMMIDHHTGAITMSEDYRNRGQNEDALELADTIIADQTTEIAEMKALLADM